MFASKITVKYPQTRDYSTWFYLTKLLTSRPLGFPAALLLAGTPFCLSCNAAGRRQKAFLQKNRASKWKAHPGILSRCQRMTQVQSSALMSYFPLKFKGKKKKKLMHPLAAVAGQLVKDRQMLPNRDFFQLGRSWPRSSELFRFLLRVSEDLTIHA